MEHLKLEEHYDVLCSSEDPKYLLIHPDDSKDLSHAEHVCEYLVRHGASPFAMLNWPVSDWNRELSPWKAPPVFGDEPFGDGAEETLNRILSVLPAYRAMFPRGTDAPVILGGYSLAAFFALWAVFRTDAFAAAVAASPSVWFPDWISFLSSQKIHTSCVYLSLGDREEKTKNPVMSAVGDCIRETHRILKEEQAVMECVLEWNPGNHFRDAGIRTAKGFLWSMRRLKSQS